jgi:hypothetical protein
VCQLRAVGASKAQPALSTSTTSPSPEGYRIPSGTTSSGKGNLIVDIPSVVFIRSRGRRWYVTTNTGKPPQETDSFYVVAHDKASLATATLTRLVLSECAASDGHR